MVARDADDPDRFGHAPECSEGALDRSAAAAAVHVRPIGHVADRPVVRRVGDRQLFLGNRHAADPVRCQRTFDAVCTVATDRAPATTHHRPVVDGPDAEWSRFRDAVDAARRCYRAEGTVLVHCRAGISRSPAVVAATVAVEEGRSLSAGFDAVLEARPPAVPHPRLHELAVWYVAAEEEGRPSATRSV